MELQSYGTTNNIYTEVAYYDMDRSVPTAAFNFFCLLFEMDWIKFKVQVKFFILEDVFFPAVQVSGLTDNISLKKNTRVYVIELLNSLPLEHMFAKTL